jgi:uncharacterized protein (TIGR03435 family)
VSFHLALAALLLPLPCALAQTAPYVPTMTFDVASVRENKQADLRNGITMSGQFAPHSTNLRLVNWRIESILSVAFGIDEWQAVNTPKWQFPTVFVIEAKGDPDADAKIATLPPDQQRMEQQHMLQELLADRFKLKAHWETKEADVYNLVVAKGGPKLGAEGSMPPSAEDVKIFGARPVPPLRQKGIDGHLAWVGNDCPISALVSILKGQMGRPVLDNTGLTGKYDFILKYKGRTDQDRNADDTDPTPPMDRALQEQLGLKLESAKGPVKVLVLDHIEKPSEN